MKNNSKSEIMDNKNYDALNQHVQLGGQAYYDERKYFMFTPAEPAPGVQPSEEAPKSAPRIPSVPRFLQGRN